MPHFGQPSKIDTLLIWLLSLAVGLFVLLSVLGQFPEQRIPLDKRCGTADLPGRISALLRGNSASHAKSRILAIVGDGVLGESLVVERPYNTQSAQGYDLYQGVKHALTKPEIQSALEHVAVLYIDDGGNPLCAGRIADILADEPHVIGIVGHTTTSCTSEALPYYRASNIPVIIPAATNPTLLEERPKNVFRLPSNDNIQALVIADMILNTIKAKSIFIVWDATPEAIQYAEYLKTTIQHLLNVGKLLNEESSSSIIIEGSYPVSLNPLNYTYLFKRIVSSDPDVVIFAGYGSLAREFLLGLDDEYSQYGDRPRPRILLTDGCKIPTLQSFNFDAKVTFAAGPLTEFPQFAGYDPGQPIGRHQRMYLTESFEVFGYDATLLFLGAMKILEEEGKGVSRKQVGGFIAERNRLIGTCYRYSFSAGENMLNRYYSYSLMDNKIDHEYTEDDIDELLRKVSFQ